MTQTSLHMNTLLKPRMKTPFKRLTLYYESSSHRLQLHAHSMRSHGQFSSSISTVHSQVGLTQTSFIKLVQFNKNHLVYRTFLVLKSDLSTFQKLSLPCNHSTGFQYTSTQRRLTFIQMISILLFFSIARIYPHDKQI